MGDLNNFELKYKKESQQLTETPPADMWNRIEASLDAKSNKKAFMWWPISVAAGVALLFLLGIQHLINSPSSNNNQLVIAPLEEDKTHENFNLPTPINAEITTEVTTSNATIYQPPIKEVDKENTIKSNDKSAKQEISPIFVSKNLAYSTTKDNANNIKTDKAIPLIAYQPDVPLFKNAKVKISNIQKERPTDNSWLEKYNVDNGTDNLKKGKDIASKVQIGGSVSPSYNFRQISNNTPYNQPTNPNSEEGIITLAAAFDLNVKVHKNWAIESGVRYARMGQQVHAGSYNESIYAMASGFGDNRTPKFSKVSLANSMGDVNAKLQSNNHQKMISTMDYASTMKVVGLEVTNNEAIAAELEQHIDYIEIPLTFRYYLPTDGAIKLSLAGGVSTNWLINNNAYLKTEGERQALGATSNISNMTWSGHAGVAMSVPLVGQLSFKIEPRINYFLSDINQEHPIGYKPYSFGLFSGVQYSFGK